MLGEAVGQEEILGSEVSSLPPPCREAWEL